MLARRLGGTITSQELCRQFPMSASTASNRLARLGELGLLVEAGEERIPGGGRRFLWQAWDACRIAPEAVSSSEVSSSNTMSFSWPDTTKRVVGIQFSREGLRYIYEDDSNTEAP